MYASVCIYACVLVYLSVCIYECISLYVFMSVCICVCVVQAGLGPKTARVCWPHRLRA